MDLELKDRRAVNHVLASFARVWPYIAIVALLGLHAVNYSKTPVRRTAAPVIRNTLYVRSRPLPGTGTLDLLHQWEGPFLSSSL